MKALVIDDHSLVRDALVRVLIGLAPGALAFEAGDAASALAIVGREPDLDLVLLDLGLPGMHGLTLLQTLRAHHPAVCVVVISAVTDLDSVKRALDCGALGFIPKSSSNEVLTHALRLVLAGGIYVPPELVGRGAEPPAPSPLDGAHAAGRRTLPADIGLTERQAQILGLVMQGEPNKRIGRRLDIAESTVKNQLTAILKALGVTSRTQAVLAVGRLGLVLPTVRAEDR